MEYHKIETLYERDERFKVKVGEFKNRTYTLLKTWHWTEKIDGTNIRCNWQGEKLSFAGKTDQASIPGDLIAWLYDHVSVERLKEVFPDTDAVLYGEGYGAGIQKGGLLSPVKKFVMFDVLVGGKWWLSYENVCDVAQKLDLAVVPDFGHATIEEATELVRNGFKSRLAVSEVNAEGLVGRPDECLFDKKGSRLIVKLKTKDF